MAGLCPSRFLRRFEIQSPAQYDALSNYYQFSYNSLVCFFFEDACVFFMVFLFLSSEPKGILTFAFKEAIVPLSDLLPS